MHLWRLVTASRRRVQRRALPAAGHWRGGWCGCWHSSRSRGRSLPCLEALDWGHQSAVAGAEVADRRGSRSCLAALTGLLPVPEPQGEGLPAVAGDCGAGVCRCTGRQVRQWQPVAGAAGACAASGSSSDDDPHPNATAINSSPTVSSTSFGIAVFRRVLVVLFISLSSCNRLRPVGRFWPSHKYRRTRCGFCSRNLRSLETSSFRRRPEPREAGVRPAIWARVTFTLTPALSPVSSTGQALRERGVMQRSEIEWGGLFRPPHCG